MIKDAWQDVMEQQCKKVFEKALEIYHREMNGIISSASTKDVDTVKKTQRRLEGELAKYLQKELKGYSKLGESVDKLLVLPLMLTHGIDKDQGRVPNEKEGGDDTTRTRCARGAALGVQENSG